MLMENDELFGTFEALDNLNNFLVDNNFLFLCRLNPW